MKQAKQLTELLTAKDVAAIARVSPKTVNRWRRDGLLRGVKVGNVVRFSPLDVEDFLNRHRN